MAKKVQKTKINPNVEYTLDVGKIVAKQKEKDKKYTLGDFSNETGIGYQTASNLNGESKTPPEWIGQVARACILNGEEIPSCIKSKKIDETNG